MSKKQTTTTECPENIRDITQDELDEQSAMEAEGSLETIGTPKKSKDEIKKEKLDVVKEKQELTQKDWIDTLKKGTIIDQAEYFQMKHYINMVLNKMENGCLILSRGGTGKTFTTLTYLSKMNIEYAYIDGFTTPAMFYIWLYKNQDKIKVIDDCHKMLESDKFSAFLKAILEGFNGKRVVFYNSTKNLEDSEGQYIPNSFEETGGTIILANRINEKNIHIDAVLSRIPQCKLEIDNSRMLELMGYMAETEYGGLTKQERLEVLQFLRERLTNSVDLNLRTFKHALNFYRYSKSQDDMTLWGRLTLQSLKKDDVELVIMQVLTSSEYKTDVERIDAINSQLAKPISERTYYNKKKELRIK